MADDLAVADQAQVARVDEFDPVFGTTQQGHEHRGFLEQLGELAPALVIVVVVIGHGLVVA